MIWFVNDYSSHTYFGYEVPRLIPKDISKLVIIYLIGFVDEIHRAYPVNSIPLLDNKYLVIKLVKQSKYYYVSNIR